MIELCNNWITVTSDEEIYSTLSLCLKFIEKGRQVRLKNGKRVQTKDTYKYVYTKDENGTMYVPSGIYWLLENELSKYNVIDKRTYNEKLLNENKRISVINHIDDYADILDGIVLRDNQLLALKKILMYNNCIAQMVTGAGKTEVLCALTKI